MENRSGAFDAPIQELDRLFRDPFEDCRSSGAGAEQKVVDYLRVLQGQGCQFARRSENGVHVRSG